MLLWLLWEYKDDKAHIENGKTKFEHASLSSLIMMLPTSSISTTPCKK
jgi:hypothetical protein